MRGPRARGRSGFEVEFDAVGVGSGVKAEVRRLLEDDEDLSGLGDLVVFHAWNAGGVAAGRRQEGRPGGPPQSFTIGEVFLNFKAQAWWSVRNRLEKCWLYREGKFNGSWEELMSLDSEALGTANLRVLEKHLCQAVRRLSATSKLMVDKQPEGMRSPDGGDSTVMNYNPVVSGYYSATMMRAMGR